MIERIEINLLPVEYRPRKTEMRLPRSIVYPLLFTLIIAIAFMSVTLYQNDRAAQLEQEIESVEKEIAANSHIQAKIDSLREFNRITEEKNTALQRISVDREKWVRLLEILSSNLPPYTWLIAVREDAGNKLNIEARSYSFPEVAHYMTRLEESEYISKTNLNSIEQIRGDERMVYRFTLVCDLNPNAGLGIAATDTAAAGGATAAVADAGQQSRRQQRRQGGADDAQKKGGQ